MGGSDRAARVSTDSQDKEVSPPRDETLPEFDPAKFTPGYIPKTVTKGEDEYMIVVSGVKDTGLCGGYWGNTENLGSRRRSKPVEALQIGKDDKKRRGSVGSVGSGVDTTPQAKKKLENMVASQSESEVDTEQNSNKVVRGKKR